MPENNNQRTNKNGQNNRGHNNQSRTSGRNDQYLNNRNGQSNFSGKDHKKNHMNTDKFTNPYNFIPFSTDACQRSFVKAQPGGLTGYIACLVELKTPLIIPNTSNNKALHESNTTDSEQICSYDFFSYTDLSEKKGVEKQWCEPIIPGSEIRGVVRSVFEAAFNGCMSSVELDRPLGRRSANSKEPGILRKVGDGWEITPCERWMLERKYHQSEVELVDDNTYNKWSEGELLYVTGKPYEKHIKDKNLTKKTPYFLAQEYSDKKISGWKCGYLHKGEPFGDKKHYESVFVEKKGASIPVSPLDMKKLEIVMKQYRDPKMNGCLRDGKTEWYKEYSLDSNFIPIYYQPRKKEGDPLYLAPACISKEVFNQSIGILLQEDGKHQPCQERDNVCPACALFGMVTKEAQGKGKADKIARSSRLRFEDATLLNPPEDNDYAKYYQDVTLPELGEPKPSAVEFYTWPPKITNSGRQDQNKSEDYGYWTYDYYCEDDNDKKKPVRKSLGSNQLKLRGRKFYWHSEVLDLVLKDQSLPTKMRQKVRALKNYIDDKEHPVTFQFRIYFENITEIELSQLRWALTFDDPNCAHKMGRAKPLGFGSVRIMIKKVYVREIDPETGKWSRKDYTEQKSHIDSTTKPIKALKIMANWENRPKDKVTYPIGQKGNAGKNATASHQWFLANRGSALSPKFAKILPKPEEELANPSKKLYALIK